MKKNQRGFKQSIQTLNQISLITKELTVLVHKLNHIVTELQ